MLMYLANLYKKTAQGQINKHPVAQFVPSIILTSMV